MNLNKIVYNLDIAVTEATFNYYGVVYEFKDNIVYLIKGDTKYQVMTDNGLTLNNSYNLTNNEVLLTSRLYDLIKMKG